MWPIGIGVVLSGRGGHGSHAPPQFSILETALNEFEICDKNMFSMIKILWLAALLISETTNNKKNNFLKIFDDFFFYLKIQLESDVIVIVKNKQKFHKDINELQIFLDWSLVCGALKDYCGYRLLIL